MNGPRVARLAELAQMIADARLHRLRLARDELAGVTRLLEDLNRSAALPGTDLPEAAAAARHAIWAAHRHAALDRQRDAGATGCAVARTQATQAFGRAQILRRWAAAARKP